MRKLQPSAQIIMRELHPPPAVVYPGGQSDHAPFQLHGHCGHIVLWSMLATKQMQHMM